MYSIILPSLLLTTLATAAVIKGTVTLKIGISTSGDDATTRDVPFGTLFKNANGDIPPASNLVIGSVSNTVTSADAVCQAFSDQDGKQKLGPTFNDTLPGIRFDSLTTIGSVFCSNAESVAALSRVSEVDIKLQFDNGEGASIGTVPVNGKLVPARGTFATAVAFSADIESQGAEGVECDVFGDAAGKQRIGVLKGDGSETLFGQGSVDVPVGAVRCVQA